MQNYAKYRPPAMVGRFERFRSKGQIRRDVDIESFVAILQNLALSFCVMLEGIECLATEDADKQIALAARVLADGVRPRTKS